MTEKNIAYPASRFEAEALIAQLQQDFSLDSVIVTQEVVSEVVHDFTVGMDDDELKADGNKENLFYSRVQKDLVAQIMRDTRLSFMADAVDAAQLAAVASLREAVDFVTSRSFRPGWQVRLFVQNSPDGDHSNPANHDLVLFSSPFEDVFTADEWARSVVGMQPAEIKRTSEVYVSVKGSIAGPMPVSRYQLSHTDDNLIPRVAVFSPEQ